MENKVDWGYRTFIQDDSTTDASRGKDYRWNPATSCIEEVLPIEGMKHDEQKLRYDLLPPGPLSELVAVYTTGAQKYSDRNWEKGITWGRIFAAMMRHAWQWWAGEVRDKEDGQHHLASVAWCAFALMQYEKTHKEKDDRPTGHT